MGKKKKIMITINQIEKRRKETEKEQGKNNFEKKPKKKRQRRIPRQLIFQKLTNSSVLTSQIPKQNKNKKITNRERKKK